MSQFRSTTGLPAKAMEFLEWPGDGRAKHYQLVDGEVRAMSPGTALHGLIQATLISLIRQQLCGSNMAYQVLTELSVKPRIRSKFISEFQISV